MERTREIRLVLGNKWCSLNTIMNEKQLTKLSKFLSLVLRHNPGAIGLTLDRNGWADVEDLLAAMQRCGKPLDRAILERIVETDNKQRYRFCSNGKRIRANQGHSIDVDLQFKPVEPPEHLYHGTATRFVTSIRAEGLQSRSRQFVHLSHDVNTALKVAQRHGKPVILTIAAGRMAQAGHEFYLSENGVWLASEVPVTFIEFPPSD